MQDVYNCTINFQIHPLLKTGLWFHFSRLATVEEMLSIGLFLNDLNFYDGSSEILISGIQHAKQLQTAIERVSKIKEATIKIFLLKIDT